MLHHSVYHSGPILHRYRALWHHHEAATIPAASVRQFPVTPLDALALVAPRGSRSPLNELIFNLNGVCAPHSPY